MPFIEAPIEIVTPPKRYAPIRHCIYCGAYSKHLSKEHIIPFGLTEDSLILPKASCLSCRDITRKQCVGTPPYRIVVGEFNGALDRLPFTKQPLHTIEIRRTIRSAQQVSI
jgi:hypothetical protein